RWVICLTRETRTKGLTSSTSLYSGAGESTSGLCGLPAVVMSCPAPVLKVATWHQYLSLSSGARTESWAEFWGSPLLPVLDVSRPNRVASRIQFFTPNAVL